MVKYRTGGWTTCCAVVVAIVMSLVAVAAEHGAGDKSHDGSMGPRPVRNRQSIQSRTGQGPMLRVMAVAASRTVRVAIYSGKGVTPGDAERVKACLPRSKGFDVTLVDAKAILGGALEKVDVLIHPGGSASGQSKALGDDGRERVRQFVEGGGGFVGICAGAYLASAEYPWALKLLDARVVDDEHWARGVGKVTLRLAPACREALATNEDHTETHYENGPLLGPAGRKEIPDFESLATFETEIRENDAPEGVMKGTTAIARGDFGKGRVVCFSTHPEKTRGHEEMVAGLVRWAGDNSRDNVIPRRHQPQRGGSQ